MGAFGNTIAAFVATACRDADDRLHEIAIEVGARLRDRSPVRTGRFRDAWRLTHDAEGLSWRNDTPYGPELEARRHFVRATMVEIPAVRAANAGRGNKP